MQQARFILLVWAGLLLNGHSAEWRELFNGRTLDGWVNVNCAPETWTVKEGIIVCTGFPTGVLRTKEHYENFILELEWKHLHPRGNAGLFIYSDPVTARGQPFTRSIECQVMDGNHGDVFAIHGATFVPDRPHPRGWMRCLPLESRAKPAGEWNHYRVESRDGKLTLAVNGKVVSGGTECNPRKGYICLESEGAEVHFRNIKIQELPGGATPPEKTAALDSGFQSIYTGLDLRGWKMEKGHEGHWRAKDWILDYDGKSTAQDPNLWTEKSYQDFVMIVDWRFPSKTPVTNMFPVILTNGNRAKNDDGTERLEAVKDYGDSGIYLRGNSKSQVNIWSRPIGSGEVYGYREDLSLPQEVRAAVTPRLRADRPVGEWNRFVITMRGDRLTVVLNDQEVISNARLPGVPPSGPIALQSHGDAVQFANLYIKELN